MTNESLLNKLEYKFGDLLFYMGHPVCSMETLETIVRRKMDKLHSKELKDFLEGIMSHPGYIGMKDVRILLGEFLTEEELEDLEAEDSRDLVGRVVLTAMIRKINRIID